MIEAGTASSARVRVVCAGEGLYDVITPRGGGTPAYLYGGQPANVAVALRRLGTRSGFAGGVGTDARGEKFVEELVAQDVDVRGVQRIAAWPTRTVLVEHAPDGERAFVGFGGAASDAFADAYFEAGDLPRDLLDGVALLVVGSLEFAYPRTRAALESLLDLASDSNTEVVVDVNRREVFWPETERAHEFRRTRQLADAATYLKASDDEARWLFGTDDPSRIAAMLPRAGVVLVTRGPQGCAYDVFGHGGKLEAYRVESLDTTGAGDAFVAGFLHRLCTDGADALHDAAGARRALRFASGVGALATTVRGAFAAMPTSDQVEAVIGAI